MKKLFLLFFLTCALASVFARGAGGMMFGYQTLTYPFLDENYDIPGNNLDLSYFGGFGYGVSRDGVITGGFGFALMDMSGESGIAGGFGGVINGIQLIGWPVQLNLLTFIGFGGIYTGSNSENPNAGFFALLGEVDLELGIPLTPWFMPSIYIGYQVAGNVIPGEIFTSFLSYTPVIGVRIAWGSFGKKSREHFMRKHRDIE
ncbi:MAG: hypothetical protein JW874_10525 [Spirochaetales bacterium]|nr:hypothetical protein [Spirochaetales bacterium]